MAVDNYTRINSLNAVIAAWTKYNSLPFLSRKLIAAGASVSYNVAHPFEGVILFAGMAAAVDGLYTLRVTSAGTSSHVGTIKAGSSLSVTWAAGVLTITNNGSQNTYAYILALNGSVEEV